MDLETENRLATMLLKEAAEMRRQAEREGALAYLRRPNVRCRPNSRFLTSTVMGIEQANRALEVSELWRARHKEIELDQENKSRSECSSGERGTHRSDSGSHNDDMKKQHRDVSCSSIYRVSDDGNNVDGKGLRDEEVEKFLHSRAKRGRGSIGSRIDETGPYLPHQPDSQDDRFLTSDHYREERQSRVALGPEKSTFWRYNESSLKDDSGDDGERKERKSKEKRHSKKRKSKEKSKSKDGKKKSSHRKRHKH